MDFIRKFTTVAILILVPTLGILAQAPQFPEEIRLLNLTQVQEVHRDSYGVSYTGQLPGGMAIEIQFNDNGLKQIQSVRNRNVPLSALAPIIPQAILQSPQWSANPTIEKVEFKDGEISISGRLADGKKFTAVFFIDGRIEEFKID